MLRIETPEDSKATILHLGDVLDHAHSPPLKTLLYTAIGVHHLSKRHPCCEDTGGATPQKDLVCVYSCKLSLTNST